MVQKSVSKKYPLSRGALKIEDVESSRGMLRVAQGKENKDRYTVLSPWLLEVARGLGEKFVHFLRWALSFEACEVRCVKV